MRPKIKKLAMQIKENDFADIDNNTKRPNTSYW